MIGISTGLLLIITPSHSAYQTLYLQHGLLFATGDLRSIHDIERASVMFCATCRVLLQKIEAGVISGDRSGRDFRRSRTHLTEHFGGT
jgi:hypothetical protein